MTEVECIEVVVEASQHEQLVKLAQAKGQSVSEVIGEMMDAGLLERERQQARQLAALEQLTQLREELERKQGIITRDLLAELRAEREEDIDRGWRGEL